MKIMIISATALPLIALSLITLSCKDSTKQPQHESVTPADTVSTKVQQIALPAPFSTHSVNNIAKVTGWPVGKTPVVPAGMRINRFADSLNNPRWIYTAENGDVFVAESNSAHNTIEKIKGKNKSGDRILLFRDRNKDGVADEKLVFLEDLNKPFGMLITGGHFYVANTDGILVYPYRDGINTIKDKPVLIMKLPAGPRHWTRNIIANADRSKIFIAVGSSTDHAEKGIDKETRRATILEINPDGSGERPFATGLRNPVGMDLSPITNELWTVVNERDELGDELVPDYLTHVRDKGFYGWPWYYFGDHVDPRLKDQQKPELAKTAIVPDLALGSHTASLGLKFYTGNSFPEKYRNGAFIGQHGSWNKSTLAGYKVIFVPFKNGRPSGPPEDFITGFIADPAKPEVYGRPVGIAMTNDGNLLVADDAGNTIWQVSNGSK